MKLGTGAALREAGHLREPEKNSRSQNSHEETLYHLARTTTLHPRSATQFT